MKLSRRSLLSATAVAATGYPALPKPLPDPPPVPEASGWITVAHTGWNKLGHSYQPGTLRKICDSATGKMITRDGIEGYPDTVIGVVADARLSSDGSTVQIRAKWLRCSPTGMFVVLSGQAPLLSLDRYPGYYDIGEQGYTLKCFYVAEESAFELATRV